MARLFEALVWCALTLSCTGYRTLVRRSGVITSMRGRMARLFEALVWCACTVVGNWGLRLFGKENMKRNFRWREKKLTPFKTNK